MHLRGRAAQGEGARRANSPLAPGALPRGALLRRAAGAPSPAPLPPRPAPQLVSRHPAVVTLRDTESVEALAARLAGARRAVVVGNGGIALELV